MKILFLILFFPSVALAGNWSCAPDNGTTYTRQSSCPCQCFTLDQPDGSVLDKELVILVSGAFEIDPALESAKQAQQAQDALDKAQRRNDLNNLKVKPVLSNQEIQDAIKLILGELNI